MKICLVSQEYPPETGWGGIGTQTYLKAQGLSARGHEVHVISASWTGAASTCRDGGAVIHRIAAPDLYVLGYDGPAYWLAYSSAVAGKIQALGQEMRFDIFQFPEYGGEGFIYQTGTFEDRTAKYVVQMHGPMAMFSAETGWPPPGSRQHRMGRFIERLVIHCSDHLLASSRNTAAYCAREYDCAERRIDVIHSGIDVSLFSPRAAAPDEAWPKILFAGKLIPSKGIATLVQAVLALRRRYPRILLRACGKAEEDLLRRLRNEIGRHGADANFRLGRNVPYRELPQQYNWCDIFAGPSVFEPGPGNVYLEAMACGKPVIACNTGGAPEVVLDGRTGLLVPPNDAEALAEAIATLAEDAAQRRGLGENGRNWVVENFSIEKYTDKVEAVYERVLSG